MKGKNKPMKIMKQISLTLLAATFFCLTTTAFAQESVAQPAKAKPIRIDKIPTEKLPVPEGISILEAKSYEFLIASSGEVTVNLYDSSNNRIAGFEVQESIAEKTLHYKITENNQEDWLKIQSQERENVIYYSAVSSSGTEMGLELQVEKPNKAGKIGVKGVNLQTGEKFSFNASNLTESRLSAQEAFQAQEQKLFNTPSLRKLKEFMQSFGILRNAALSKWTGVSQEKAVSCKQEITANLVQLPTNPCSGTAVCTRMTTLTPLFICNSVNCGFGIYLIPDCVINVVCRQNCSDLMGCA